MAKLNITLSQYEILALIKGRSLWMPLEPFFKIH